MPDIKMIQMSLEHFGRSALELADQLTSDKGRKLSGQELELIRMCLLPAIREEFNIAVARYIMTGDFHADFGPLTEF